VQLIAFLLSGCRASVALHVLDARTRGNPTARGQRPVSVPGDVTNPVVTPVWFATGNAGDGRPLLLRAKKLGNELRWARSVTRMRHSREWFLT
jgi:hypothetical protein